jgi:EAL domain-containing protein (putative c-di-GMP-specific phosphodiesterase class I)
MSPSAVCAPIISAEVEHCTFAVHSIRSLVSGHGGFGARFDWFEVLIRPHGDHLNSSPAEFIERLYRERETVHTDTEVLRRVAAWAQSQRNPTRISVNTHPESLTHGRFIEQVLKTHRALAGFGHSLCLELIEYGRCDEKNALVSNAHRLRKAGVLIALDDFGSRINCFDLCAAGIVDLLKIDLRLIDGLERDPNQQAVINSILTLGRGLGARVVAEGVETAGQAAILHQMGVDFAQGFYFHKPQRLDI